MNTEELNTRLAEMKAVVAEKEKDLRIAQDALSVFANSAANEISEVKVGDRVREYSVSWVDKIRRYKPDVYEVSLIKWVGYGDLSQVEIYGRKVLKDGKSLHKTESRIYGKMEKVS